MKRFFSVGLLVSILVAIQAFAGCVSSPQTGDSQKIITITGLDQEFNGKYATVSFLDENNVPIAASLLGQISGGSVTLELYDAAAGNPPFTKNGNYSVGVLIFNTDDISSDNVFWRGGTKTNITSTTTTVPFSSLQQVN